MQHPLCLLWLDSLNYLGDDAWIGANISATMLLTCYQLCIVKDKQAPVFNDEWFQIYLCYSHAENANIF